MLRGPVGNGDVSLHMSETGTSAVEGERRLPSLVLPAQALPLLLTSERTAAFDGARPLDETEMHTGVYILAHEGPREWRRLYEFARLERGPYSADLASDLRRMQRDGLLLRHLVAEREAFEATEDGEQWLDTAVAHLDPTCIDFALRMRQVATHFRHGVTPMTPRSFGQ